MIGGFGDRAIDLEKRIFELSSSATSVWSLERGQNLRMLLTNPEEFRLAVREGWKAINELQSAKVNGCTQVLKSDARGKELWELL